VRFPVTAILSIRTSRGVPGDDHTDWGAIVGALDAVGYNDSVVIESFTSENQTSATAASIWRPLASSQDEIAAKGLAFLREVLGKNKTGHRK
jgi:D-psicose/D-tagatose/L-ribulose 3-epimerase